MNMLDKTAAGAVSPPKTRALVRAELLSAVEILRRADGQNPIEGAQRIARFLESVSQKRMDELATSAARMPGKEFDRIVDTVYKAASIQLQLASYVFTKWWGVADVPMWVVVRAKQGQIAKALHNLRQQDFPCYAPKLRVTVVRRRKKMEIERFLFANYVFVEISRQWTALRNTYGVGSVLRNGDEPGKVPPQVISKLRAMEGPDGYVRLDRSLDAFRPGQRVLVTGGLFEGQNCDFVHVLGADRARVIFPFGLVTLPLKDLAAHGGLR
jgi:transcription antitermination factor NusG